MKAPSIIEFTTDPQLLGLTLSPAQETLLRAVYGLPLDAEQLELWQLCTGREEYLGRAFSEVTAIAGARAGKDSRLAAPVVVYEAVFGGHERHLSRGERGMIPLVAQDSRAAGIAFGYIKDYLIGSPLLAGMVEKVLSAELELSNGITAACFPSTLRSLRGWSIPVAVLDELAFFRLEGQADSDVEIQASVRRGQLSFPRPKLVKISTPYLKGGVLFEDYSKHFGEPSPDILVWQASSVRMNPSLAADGRLERLRRLDPHRYAREYLAEFSDDLAAFLPYEWLEAAVVSGRYEVPPLAGRSYYAAVDPSGGGADAFTFSVVHVERDGTGAPPRVVQDLLRGWGGRGRARGDGGAPHLRGVVAEIAGLCRDYRLSSVTGDRYAAGWVRQAFQEEGIRYEESKLDRTQAYLETLPLFSQRTIELLDHPRQLREFQCLERRTRAGGKDRVDHPRGGHDDYANVTALAAARAIAAGRRPRDPWRFATSQSWVHVGGEGIPIGRQM